MQDDVIINFLTLNVVSNMSWTEEKVKIEGTLGQRKNC